MFWEEQTVNSFYNSLEKTGGVCLFPIGCIEKHGSRIFFPGDELYVKSRSQGFGDEVKRRILLGTFALSSGYYDEYYARASALRGKMYSEISDVFSKCDLLICPTARSTAKLLGSKSFDTELYRDDILTSPANLCGIPAISLPAGKDEKGLPIGLQIMAPRLSENLLLSAAKTFEMRKEG